MTLFHGPVRSVIGMVSIVGLSFGLGRGLGAAPSPASSSPSSTSSSSTDVVMLGVDGRVNATPWVAAEGRFVAVAWGASTNGKTDVFVAVSSDRGRTFAAPAQVNIVPGEARLGGELPPRVALVPRAGGAVPQMVVLWTARTQAGETRTTEIKTTRSRDGGRTFDPPIALQASAAVGDRGWPSLALDDRGAAHAIWLDHRGLAAERREGANHAAHRAATHDGVAMAQKSGLYYASTREPRVSERELTTGVCYCCKTTLAAGRNGAVYAAWRHVYPGNLRDIAFSTSRDGGRSFSPPERVSQDQWAINGCPDDGPAMALDASGRVHVIWPTVIGSAEAPEGALFYASTTDGRTFTPRMRIETLGSPKPTHPQIAIDGRGRIAVAWDELVDGARVAVVRTIRTAAGAMRAGELIRLSARLSAAGTADAGAERAAMYPVLAATADGFVAVWTNRTGDTSLVGVRAISPPQ